MTAPKPGPPAQLYCSRCAGWEPIVIGPTVAEQRAAHAARCLGAMTTHPDLVEFDARLNRLAGLYVDGDAP